jgi:hypothetical protein
MAAASGAIAGAGWDAEARMAGNPLGSILTRFPPLVKRAPVGRWPLRSVPQVCRTEPATKSDNHHDGGYISGEIREMDLDVLIVMVY